MRTLDLPLVDGLVVAHALWRARGAHVARLVDVGDAPESGMRLTIDDGEVPLRRVLERGITLGEAVTVLVPLIGCVVRLGEAGIDHGGVGVDAVRLDARGAPVLGGFTASATGVEADRIALVGLIDTVLSAIVPEGEDAALLLAELERLRGGRRSGLIAFAARLREAAPATPVRLTVREEPIPRPAPGAESHRRLRLRLRLRLRARFWVPAAVVIALAAIVLPTIAPGEAAPEPAPSQVATSPSAEPGEDDPPADPIAAARTHYPQASTATVIDDYGDIVLVRLETDDGRVDVLLERTESGWRLRGTIPTPGASTQMPRSAAKSPASRRSLMVVRKRAASAPSMIRWSYDSAR